MIPMWSCGTPTPASGCDHSSKDHSPASASWWGDRWETYLGAGPSVVLLILRHWCAAVFVSEVLKWAPSAFKSPVIRGSLYCLDSALWNLTVTLSFHLLITVVTGSEWSSYRNCYFQSEFSCSHQLGLLFPFVSCFLKQIIGSPIIIMYLSLKKTFSLYWGIQVRADLLCIRKLAQGVLVTLQPSPWDTGAMKCTCFQLSFTQSANPQVFHIGSKTCLEPLRGQGSLASCLGMNTEG